MSSVLAAIARRAATAPRSAALDDGSGECWDAETLWQKVQTYARQLRDSGVQLLALQADNSPEWIATDLAALAAGIPCVPLPLFFSPEQVAHVLARTGADAIATDQPERWLGRASAARAWSGRLALMQLAGTPAVQAPAGTAKITFTSGSTGQPKGVCLPEGALDAVSGSLARLVAETGVESHLCLLPLPVLLENVAGVYAALRAGIACRVPALAEVGLSGSQGLDPGRLASALNHHQPGSIILLPQMLKALLDVHAAGAPLPGSLRLAAVGGARVSAPLVQQARMAGIPVYEGYGLSECASVVAVNRPGQDRPGSVGKPLEHLQLRIDEHGEIHVLGPHYLGYLGDAPAPAEEVPTGDLGYLDDDGFLHITGRRKHLIISSFGRNISPEWVEGELLAHPGILQCVVYGEARPWLSALINAPGLSDADIQHAVEHCNRALPDYARIHAWLRPDAPFSPANQQLTTNGRPRRDAIFAHYGERLNALYP